MSDVLTMIDEDDEGEPASTFYLPADCAAKLAAWIPLTPTPEQQDE